MKRSYFHKPALLFIALFLVSLAQAQGGIIRGMGNRRFPSGGGGGGGGRDSLQRRDFSEDSLTIRFRFLDSARNMTFDSSISDHTHRFPIPGYYGYLGNVGTAARSLLFAPPAKVGWDPGFHQFDIYKWHLDKIRFYNTTRPYTELGYGLGSQTQQIIEILHTQNIRPYWNFSLQYRLINAPGFYKNQKTNHNNYLLGSWYESQNKRYNNYFILLSNNLQSGENGGIAGQSFLEDPAYSQRFNIPTKLGGNTPFGRDFFNTELTTGNRYNEFNAVLRQQYDFGRKDSLVSDSTVIPLFYPRVRLEHTANYGKYNYRFQDIPNGGIAYIPDSNYYKNNYGIRPNAGDSIYIRDDWREITNDFSVYTFPDEKNLQQFFKAGAGLQLLQGDFRTGRRQLYNLMAHGEYRNRTRNQKWDLQAYGLLYLNGYNAGDYLATLNLQRFLGQRWGSLHLGFRNSNRSAPFIYDESSSFYLDASKSFGKENTIQFSGTVVHPGLQLQLGGDYFIVTNYLYLNSFFQLQQESALFNVLRLRALKTFQLSRKWKIYSELHVQQKAGNVALNLPLVYTRNRIAFEGNFFRNLFLSTGLEVRYHTPYRADNYSPVLGQFFYQDSLLISNRPFVDAYFNFRIRSFKAYFRAENFNTLGSAGGSFGFRKNNLAAPDYPYPGLVIRLGIYWSFVN